MKHNTTQKSAPLVIRIFSEQNFLVVQNNVQKRQVIEGSNGQGLENLKNLYHYLTEIPVTVTDTPAEFTVKIPLLEL